MTTVTDTLPDYPDTSLTFYRRGGSFGVLESYPPAEYTVTTDGDGSYEIDLWANGEGLLPSEYLVVYPGKEAIRFVLPDSDAPITMQDLRAQEAWNWNTSPVPTALDLERARYANTSSEALGDALIGTRQPHVGAVGRTVHSKLAEILSVTDFGVEYCDPADAADHDIDVDANTTALQAAFDALRTQGGGTLLFPYGYYPVHTGVLELRSQQSISFVGQAGYSGDFDVDGLPVLSGAIIGTDDDGDQDLLDLRGNFGFVMDGVSLNYRSIEYTGTLLNLRGNDEYGYSAFLAVRNCQISGTHNVAGTEDGEDAEYATGVDVAGCHTVNFINVKFSLNNVHISGTDANHEDENGFAIAITGSHCFFSRAVTTSLRDGGNGWSFTNCTWNNGYNGHGRHYGAHRNKIKAFSDGAITALSTTFTSASLNFVDTDEGGEITINGAGPGGAALTTTIDEYVSESQVTLADAASTTVAAAAGTFTQPLPVRGPVSFSGGWMGDATADDYAAFENNSSALIITNMFLGFRRTLVEYAADNCGPTIITGCDIAGGVPSGADRPPILGFYRTERVRVTDAVLVAASTTVTSATAGFTADDVGNMMRLGGAGASGATMRSRIAAYISPTQVTIADAVVTSVNPGAITFWRETPTAGHGPITLVGNTVDATREPLPWRGGILPRHSVVDTIGEGVLHTSLNARPRTDTEPMQIWENTDGVTLAQMEITDPDDGLVRMDFYATTPKEITDAVTTRNSTTLTSASASFDAASDEDRIIRVVGAGWGGTTLTTRIASVDSSTQVTLVDKAGTTATGLTARWTRQGSSGMTLQRQRISFAGASIISTDTSRLSIHIGSSTRVAYWEEVTGRFIQEYPALFQSTLRHTGTQLGFYGAALMNRPTTAYSAATFAANTSGITNGSATYDGYTVGQVVKALRDLGLLT